MMQLVSHWVLLILLPQHPLMPILATIASASCSDRFTGYRLCCWMDTLGLQTRLCLLYFQNYRVDAQQLKGIPGKQTHLIPHSPMTLTARQCHLLINFILLPNHFMGYRGGNELFLLCCSSSGPQWNQGSVTPGKRNLLGNSWPWAHTVQQRKGRWEGKQKSWRKKWLASGYRGSQWQRQGPRSFLNAVLLQGTLTWEIIMNEV